MNIINKIIVIVAIVAIIIGVHASENSGFAPWVTYFWGWGMALGCSILNSLYR